MVETKTAVLYNQENCAERHFMAQQENQVRILHALPNQVSGQKIIYMDSNGYVCKTCRG